MTLGSNFDGSGWYDDPYTASKEINGGRAWKYGEEAWCNL